jgi:dTDP-4-dehydrorhamnose 3,5-epimerase
MKFIPTSLNGAYIIELEPFRDERGFFARTFCKKEFSAIGHDKEFVQFNHSMTRQKGTVRGMHYQVPPSAETKLIRCISGEVCDVIIDIRHGFQTLADDSQMIYHHTAYYNPENERGLRYSDPALGIKWPLPPVNLTEKDQNYPLVNNQFKGIKI